MKRIPVRSSVIRSVGYDSKNSTLEVEFMTRLVYHYLQVPRTKFKALLEASSKGRYFNYNIKDRYPFEMIKA